MTNDIKNKDLYFKDVFSMGFKIYSANIKTIVALAILVYIPISLLDVIVIEPNMQSLLMLFESHAGANNAGSIIDVLMNFDNLPIEIMGSITRLVYTIMAALVISETLFMPLLSSGSAHLVQGSANDKEYSTDDTVSNTLSNILKTFVTALLSFSFIVLGLSLFIIPGLYLYVVLAFAIPAVIVSGKWGFGALSESFLVVRGQWFKVFALILITSFIAPMVVQIAALIITVPIYILIPNEIIINAIAGIVSNIMLTYLIMVECLWFVNKYFLKIKNKYS